MDDLATLILVLGASALAIALLVLLNVILGGWRPARLKSADDAVRIMADGVFGFQASQPVGLDAAGRAALAREMGGTRLGLAQALGDRITVRALKPGDVKTVTRDGVRLTLTLADYTLPRAELRFADANEAISWQEAAHGFTTTLRPGEPSEPNHA